MKGLLKTIQFVLKEAVTHHVLIIGKLDRILNGLRASIHDHLVEPSRSELHNVGILFYELHVLETRSLPRGRLLFLPGLFNDFLEVDLGHVGPPLLGEA